jgi:uncharacterized membrane protein
MRFTQQREIDRPPFGSADTRPSPAMARMLERVEDALERQTSAAREMRDGHDAVTERVLERLAGLEDQVAALAARLEPPVAEEVEPQVAEPEPEPAAPGPVAPLDGVPESRWRETVAGVLHRPRARCAVCQRDASLRSRQELALAGWTITGRWGVCPTCRSEAWHLSHDGGLPFRVRATNGA